MSIDVEVVCVWPERTLSFKLRMEKGCTVGQAVASSGLLDVLPGLGDLAGRVGVYGKLVALHQELRNRDRIEIYRSLLADPKEVRRSRARKR